MKNRSMNHKRTEKSAVLKIVAAASLLVLAISMPAVADFGGRLHSNYAEAAYEGRFEIAHLTLFGVTDYEVAEIFNDIVIQTPGVAGAERIRLHLDPDRPKSCFVTWKIKAEDIGLSELESRIYRALRDVSADSPDAPSIAFTFAPEKRELEILKHIRPFQSSTGEIQFVLDRPRRHENRSAGTRWERDYGRGAWRSNNWGGAGFE